MRYVFLFCIFRKLPESKCLFSAEYYDFSNDINSIFKCDEVALVSGFCLFHDENYLSDRIHSDQNKQKIKKRLEEMQHNYGPIVIS
jgi:hypothetical protein